MTSKSQIPAAEVQQEIESAPSNETLVNVLQEAKLVGVLAKGWKVRAVRTGHLFALYNSQGFLRAFVHTTRTEEDAITVPEFIWWRGLARSQAVGIPFLIAVSRKDGFHFVTADADTPIKIGVRTISKLRGPEVVVYIDFGKFKSAKGETNE